MVPCGWSPRALDGKQRLAPSTTPAPPVDTLRDQVQVARPADAVGEASIQFARLNPIQAAACRKDARAGHFSAYRAHAFHILGAGPHGFQGSFAVSCTLLHGWKSW